MKELFVMLSLAAAPAPAQTGPVKAGWKPFYYSGPDFRRYDCGPALMALDDILSAVEARRVRRSCSWNYGLRADWETLAPYKENPSRARIDGLMERLGTARLWRELTEGDAPVDAHWQSARMSLSISDLRACNIASEILDQVLATLPVRNVNETVFCDSYSSMISASFEYLQRNDPEPRPRLSGPRTRAGRR